MILNYASDQIREKIKLTMHLTQNNKAYSDSDVQVMPSTN